MLLILPIASFALVFLILRKRGIDWRRAALAAAVFWGTCVVVITETLSMPHLVTPGAVAIFWLAICIASTAYLSMPRRRIPHRSPVEDSSRPGLDSATKGLLIASAIIVLFVLVTALVAPPNVWEAMEYQLPRVMMWMSNRSIRFFPTPDYRQVVFGPWAEYAMMHTYLLSGGDRFVNLVEFSSLLGSVLSVSLIAKSFGAGLRGQALAATICVTIPGGILEASGAMNTLVGSFWIAATVAFLICWNDDPSWLNTVCVGLSAGLALLTKGTAYVFLPLMVLACWLMGSRSSRILFLRCTASFLFLILVLNTPQCIRCYELSGSPLGILPPEEEPAMHIIASPINMSGTLANLIRNISLHLGTPSASVNAKTESIARAVIRQIGVNPDDPGAVWMGDRFQIWHFSLEQTHAGNPLHLALLLVAIGIVLWNRRDLPRQEAFWFALGIAASFTFFCATIKWTLWSSRYQLPIFVLGSALTGFVVDRWLPRRLGTAAAILLVGYALPFALLNRYDSLVPWSRVEDIYHPRSALYFSDEHTAEFPIYRAAAAAIEQLGCRDIAIDSYRRKPKERFGSKSFFVYPLFALIHADGRERRVWYTGVDNLTTRFEVRQAHPVPCAVVCLECASIPAKWTEYRRAGGRASVFDYIVIFSANGTLPNS